MGTGLDIWGQGWTYGDRAGLMGTGLGVWGQGWTYGERAGRMGTGLDDKKTKDKSQSKLRTTEHRERLFDKRQVSRASDKQTTW